MRIFIRLIIIFFLLGTGVLIELKAQSPCDDLSVTSVTYAPFTDTLIQITLQNTGIELFDLPGIILFDQNGDTLAMESVDLFGIGPTSIHQLEFHANAIIPNGPFMATLELWTDFYAQLTCTFSLIADLCPSDTCTSVYVDLGNFGGALVTSNFDWMITDTLLNELASGTFELTTLVQQSDRDSVCLPHGNYLYWVNSPQATGGQLFFAVNSGPLALSGPGATLIQGGGDQNVPFTLFESCIDTPQAIEDPTLELLEIQVVNGLIHIVAPGNRKIGPIEIYDLQGRVVFRKNIAASTAILDLGDRSTGVYLFKPQNTFAPQSFFLER